MPETRNLRRNEKRLTPFEMQSDEPTLIIANFNRRQGSKKKNQRVDKKNSTEEALIYSPLMNANLDQQAQIASKRNMSGEDGADADVKEVETKIRSGFFNDNTLKMTPYIDGFYVGNSVSISVNILSCSRNFDDGENS